MLKNQYEINQKFGKLTITAITDKKLQFICGCSKKVWISIKHFRYKKNTSCGCQNKKVGKQHSRYTGFQDISCGYLSSYKSKAKKRSLEWNITAEDVWNQYLKQNGRCALTGIKIRFEPITKIRKNTTASIDRIDSSKGYTKDNIQIVHKYINMMKKDLSNKEFIELCQEWLKSPQNLTLK